MDILNEEPIYLGILMADNIKFMADTPQQSCRHFYFINELWRWDGVPTQPDDVMIRPIAPIRKSTMRRFPTQTLNESGLDEVQWEEQDPPSRN